MSFYDELGDQLRQAELLLEAEAAASQARELPGGGRKRRRWLALPRPIALGGLVAILAAVVFVAISSNTRTSIARAGLAILDADAVDASQVPLSSEQAKLANSRTAHPFDTPNGTGYAFLSRGPRGERNLCVAVPETSEMTDNYPATCQPQADAEAKGLVIGLVPEAPAIATDVLVLPVGVAVARFTPNDGGPARTLPSVNGVVAFQPPSDGVLSWNSARGIQREDVVRSFPESKLRFECRDGTIIYRREKEWLRARNTICRPYGGVRELLGLPLTKSEADAKDPRNRSDAPGLETPAPIPGFKP